MTIPTSMGLHKLEVAKGDRNSVVDWTATLDQTDPVSVAASMAGRVMTLNSSGNFVAGVAIGKMPFYAWSGTDINNYPDVERDRGMANAGTPQFVCISWRSPNELTTTEIDPAGGIAAALLPGVALTAKAITCATPSQRGMFTTQKAGTDLLVGYVGPRGVYTGPDGYSTLSFYPAYVPGSTVDAT
jgi:hypothetical protein